MEGISNIFPEQIASILPEKQVGKANLKDAPDAKKVQAAKDFESLIINNLLSEMKNTVGDWGFEKDSASGQVDGIFWQFLSGDLADQGGLGLWKDIYNSMPSEEQVNQSGNIIDGCI